MPFVGQKNSGSDKLESNESNETASMKKTVREKQERVTKKKDDGAKKQDDAAKKKADAARKATGNRSKE